jgi:hypothetical protein
LIQLVLVLGEYALVRAVLQEPHILDLGPAALGVSRVAKRLAEEMAYCGEAVGGHGGVEMLIGGEC